MRKESLNIAVACFIGGMLGVLFAVKTAEMYEFGHYFWFAGAFLGGAIAYLVYDPVVFASAMRRAWRELADVEYAKRCLYATFVAVEVISLSAVIVVGVTFTFFGGVISFAMGLLGDDVNNVAINWFIGACALMLLVRIAWGIHSCSLSQKSYKNLDMTFRDKLRRGAFFLNPVVLPLLLTIVSPLYILWKGVCAIAWLLWRAPKAAWHLTVFTARFVGLTFVYIHSTARVVCFVDTALGVAVAYALVSPTLQAMLAGGAFGLVFGVLNYELVSVRILKLVPARANAKK